MKQTVWSVAAIDRDFYYKKIPFLATMKQTVWSMTATFALT